MLHRCFFWSHSGYMCLVTCTALLLFHASQGFYVTIDFHFEQSGLQNNPTLFASEWRRLWSDLVSLPTYNSSLEGRVFPELANEWDKFGCRWDTAGGRSKQRADQSWQH